MYNPIISIIIPFFNRERTLHYCINSVLNQTYKNWELLLVDDGSTDSSAKICYNYANKDRRIHYYNQENKGAGPARNFGIEKATGNWITFVDSDDAIMPDHLTQLQQHGEGNDLVMVNHCTAKYENGQLVKQSEYWNDIDNTQISGNKNILEFLYVKLNPYKTYNYCCWDKFFSMKVIRDNNLRYPTDVPTGQDMMFVVNYFKYTENFYFSNIGTYAQTPMGNEGIEHLGFRLRAPEEYLHCHQRNYDNLQDLYRRSQKVYIREYAVNYILSDTFTRAVLRYTNWRNRRIIGKKEIVRFMDLTFKPIIENLKTELNFVQDNLFRSQFQLILMGKTSAVYDYWFYKDLKKSITGKLKRLFR